MLHPKITDPEIIRQREAARIEADKKGGFYDPDLDAWLTEQEQEPDYWERKAALAEKLWPSKKKPEQDSEAEINPTPSSGQES
jgi:hypothetical protein